MVRGGCTTMIKVLLVTLATCCCLLFTATPASADTLYTFVEDLSCDVAPYMDCNATLYAFDFNKVLSPKSIATIKGSIVEDVALSYNGSYWTLADTFTSNYEEKSTIIGVSLSNGAVKQLAQEFDQNLKCLLQQAPSFYTLTTDSNMHFKISSIDMSSETTSLLFEIDTVAKYGIELYANVGDCALVYNAAGGASITWLAFGYDNESSVSESTWLFSYDLSTSALTTSMLSLQLPEESFDDTVSYPITKWGVSGIAFNTSSPDGTLYSTVSVYPFSPNAPPTPATYCSLAVIPTNEIESKEGVNVLEVRTYGDNLCESGSFFTARKLLPTPQTSDLLYTYLYPLQEHVSLQYPSSIVALNAITGSVVAQYSIPVNVTGIQFPLWSGGFVGL